MHRALPSQIPVDKMRRPDRSPVSPTWTQRGRRIPLRTCPSTLHWTSPEWHQMSQAGTEWADLPGNKSQHHKVQPPRQRSNRRGKTRRHCTHPIRCCWASPPDNKSPPDTGLLRCCWSTRWDKTDRPGKGSIRGLQDQTDPLGTGNRCASCCTPPSWPRWATGLQRTQRHWSAARPRRQGAEPLARWSRQRPRTGDSAAQIPGPATTRAVARLQGGGRPGIGCHRSS